MPYCNEHRYESQPDENGNEETNCPYCEISTLRVDLENEQKQLAFEREQAEGAMEEANVELEAWRSGRLRRWKGTLLAFIIYTDGLPSGPYDTIEAAVDALIAEREE